MRGEQFEYILSKRCLEILIQDSAGCEYELAA